MVNLCIQTRIKAYGLVMMPIDCKQFGTSTLLAFYKILC